MGEYSMHLTVQEGLPGGKNDVYFPERSPILFVYCLNVHAGCSLLLESRLG